MAVEQQWWKQARGAHKVFISMKCAVLFCSPSFDQSKWHWQVWSQSLKVYFSCRNGLSRGEQRIVSSKWFVPPVSVPSSRDLRCWGEIARKRNDQHCRKAFLVSKMFRIKYFKLKLLRVSKYGINFHKWSLEPWLLSVRNNFTCRVTTGKPSWAKMLS
jgi:hypothetical protein